MLATANIRYAELTDRLDEEKKRAALLEVRGEQLHSMATSCLAWRNSCPAWHVVLMVQG